MLKIEKEEPMEQNEINTFGSYVKAKRKEKKVKLTDLAKKSEMAIAYLSDIENGYRNAPSKEKIDLICEGLALNEDEKALLFDLAAKGRNTRKNCVPPDMAEYIMKEDRARVALRLARDFNVGPELWDEVIKKIKEKN